MKIACTILVEFLLCGALLAQPIPAASDDKPDVTEAVDASYVIFSNLGSNPHERFNSEPFFAFTIAGKSASGNETERWEAIRFSPKVDVQAKILAAAVGYTSGTKLVTLGIYSNNEATGSVGDPLPGGQASTTRIPDLGQCCQLTKVTLPGDGVFLAANELFWLVIGPDNDEGADFLGGWQLSNLAAYAGLAPPAPWQNAPGAWPAAEIRGTQLQMLGGSDNKVSAPSTGTAASNAIVFTNLDRGSDLLYLFGSGLPIYGNEVPFEPEIWEALPFTPKADFHAKTLAAAIAWISGTKLINLGIYSDDAGSVGAPLPGGQGSTTEIPELGDCCELTKVRLSGAGVPLSAGVQYWLVVSPDNTRAPTFGGAWQTSVFAVTAYQEPENFINWTSLNGLWLAAEIRGTSP